MGMALDSFGNVYVVGYSTNSDGNDDMVIWKYKSNGSLDTSFGFPDGFVIHGNAAGGNSDDRGSDIALDLLGNIYVVGYSVNADAQANKDMVIWKYKSDGSLDTTFNTTGIVVHHNAAGGSSDDEGSEIALDDAGNIYITGYSNNGSNDDMVIWKYDNNGSLNTNFGSNGLVVDDSAALGNASDRGNDIALDDVGNIYVVGYSFNIAGNKDMIIWKYDNNGSVDTNFGSNGIVVDNSAAGGDSFDEGIGMALDSLGNIYITGYSNNSAANRDMIIWKYDNNGSVDTNFGSNGIVVYANSTGTNDANGNGIVLDSLGNIYVAGWSSNTNDNPNDINFPNDNDMAIWKYTSNGTLDSTFGAGGIVTDHNAAGGNEADHGNGILLDTLGNIYVTGWSTTTVNVTNDMVIWKYK
ncbi:MAG: SBBP repeat-containing protein [Sulfurovum sp.]|nr:SBBP repeat-containing protein [Sulfurovum sp.]